MKSCPFCCAEIPEPAVKCRYCGEWVERRAATPTSPAPTTDQPVGVRFSQTPPTQGATKPCPYCAAQIPVAAWACLDCKRNALGLAGLGLAIAAIFFFGFWLPGYREGQQKYKEIKELQESWKRERQQHEEITKKMDDDFLNKVNSKAQQP